MPQVKIGNKKLDSISVLKVNIGDKTYSVPTAKHLPYKQLRTLKDGADMDGIFTLFSKYIPEEVLEEFTVDDFKTLMEAWAEASKADGVELGK